MATDRYIANLDVDKLIYVLAHDLQAAPRNLRQCLALYDHAGGREGLNEDAARYIRRMEATMDRFDDTIGALLSLSRVTKKMGETQVLEPDAIARQVATEAGITLNVKSTVPTVQCDPGHLKSLFVELVDNVAAHAGSNAQIEFSYDNGWYRFADNGAGVDPAIRDQVFTVFRPVPVQSSRHWGLGLCKCHRIVSATGGRIEMECPESGGTVFWFQLGEGPW